MNLKVLVLELPVCVGTGGGGLPHKGGLRAAVGAIAQELVDVGCADGLEGHHAAVLEGPGGRTSGREE